MRHDVFLVIKCRCCACELCANDTVAKYNIYGCWYGFALCEKFSYVANGVECVPVFMFSVWCFIVRCMSNVKPSILVCVCLGIIVLLIVQFG